MPAPRRPFPTLRARFDGRRRPSRWTVAVLVAVGVASALQLHDTRGTLVAALALVLYAVVLAGGALWPDRATAWSAAHPRLDGLLIVPLTFVALAVVTRLGLGWCLVGAVVVWLVVSVIGAYNRRGAGRAGRLP